MIFAFIFAVCFAFNLNNGLKTNNQSIFNLYQRFINNEDAQALLDFYTDQKNIKIDLAPTDKEKEFFTWITKELFKKKGVRLKNSNPNLSFDNASFVANVIVKDLYEKRKELLTPPYENIEKLTKDIRDIENKIEELIRTFSFTQHPNLKFFSKKFEITNIDEIIQIINETNKTAPFKDMSQINKDIVLNNPFWFDSRFVQYQTDSKSSTYSVISGVNYWINKEPKQYLVERGNKDKLLLLGCGQLGTHNHKDWYTVDMNLKVGPDLCCEILRNELFPKYLANQFKNQIDLLYEEHLEISEWEFNVKTLLKLANTCLKKDGILIFAHNDNRRCEYNDATGEYKESTIEDFLKDLNLQNNFVMVYKYHISDWSFPEPGKLYLKDLSFKYTFEKAYKLIGIKPENKPDICILKKIN